MRVPESVCRRHVIGSHLCHPLGRLDILVRKLRSSDDVEAHDELQALVVPRVRRRGSQPLLALGRVGQQQRYGVRRPQRRRHLSREITVYDQPHELLVSGVLPQRLYELLDEPYLDGWRGVPSRRSAGRDLR